MKPTRRRAPSLHVLSPLEGNRHAHHTNHKCVDFKAAKRRLDVELAAKRKPFEDKFRDCTEEAAERFDGANKDTAAEIELAREQLVRDRKKCKQKYTTSVAPIEKHHFDDLDELWQAGHDGLAFTENLIVAWKELESDAKNVQRRWGVGRRFLPPIVYVESFDQLVREFKFDRCATDLTLVALVKGSALVLNGEERSFASLVTDMKLTTKLKVDEILHVQGRQIDKGPSIEDNSGLQRFRRMLGANVLVLALDTWQATQLTTLNKQWLEDPVVDCVPSLVGRGIIGNPTDPEGKTALTVFNVPDGDYQLKLMPKDWSKLPAGPDTTPKEPSGSRVWKPLQARVTVEAERIIRVAPESGFMLAGDDLTAELQPVWMKSYAVKERKPDATLIVVHHTAKMRPGPWTREDTANILKQFTDNAGKKNNADYTICPDGQTIKLVGNDKQSRQAGCSYWRRITELNSHSLGIEIMHAQNTPYEKAQVDSLIRLLKELVMAKKPKLKLKPENIIGHSDIATATLPHSDECEKAFSKRLLTRRTEDPGPLFDWEALRRLRPSLGIPVGARSELPPFKSSDLRKFFNRFPRVRLQLKDDDKIVQYGGEKRDPTQVPANLVNTLQTRLRDIGYSCVPTGVYNRQTELAVGAFQMHFLPEEATSVPIFRKVTSETADMIELVAIKLVAP